MTGTTAKSICCKEAFELNVSLILNLLTLKGSFNFTIFKLLSTIRGRNKLYFFDNLCLRISKSGS